MKILYNVHRLFFFNAPKFKNFVIQLQKKTSTKGFCLLSWTDLRKSPANSRFLARSLPKSGVISAVTPDWFSNVSQIASLVFFAWKITGQADWICLNSSQLSTLKFWTRLHSVLIFFVLQLNFLKTETFIYLFYTYWIKNIKNDFENTK